jgi:hypothetical protein
MFWKNILPPSSGLKSAPSKQQALSLLLHGIMSQMTLFFRITLFIFVFTRSFYELTASADKPMNVMLSSFADVSGISLGGCVPQYRPCPNIGELRDLPFLSCNNNLTTEINHLVEY